MTIKGYCVYEHWRPDTDQCFHVGKGTRRRPWQASGRNRRHKGIQTKLRKNGIEFEVRIIVDGLTDEQAKKLEMERIRYWRELGVDLANYTDGGDGCVGRNPSPETRAKLSASLTGKKHSEETKAKLRKIFSGRKAGAPSRETKEKISASNKQHFGRPEVRAILSSRTKSLGIRPPNGEATRFKKGQTPHNKGVPCSEEMKARISAALKGSIPWSKGRIFGPPSDESRRRRSEALKGRPRPQWVKDKIAATHRKKRREYELLHIGEQVGQP